MKSAKCLMSLLLLLVCLAPLAAGSKPLSLKSSLPESGSVGLPVDQNLELEFSNNVVNLKVQDNNRNAIVLKNEQGVLIAVEILFPDDQLEPEKKRIITIDPVENLERGARYALVIDGSLQSKNGMTLGESVVIEFATAE